MTKPISVASAEKFGATAKTEHIVTAVKTALKRAGLTRASSVLLFLTNGYTQDLKNALRVAAQAAGTLQIYGATAAGLLTQNHWILDNEGAAVMVFPDNCDLQPVNLLASQDKLNPDLPLLCLTSPEHSKLAINHPQWGQFSMFGALTSNAYGTSEYPIWQASRIAKTGFIHMNFHLGDQQRLTAHTVVSQGVRRISGNFPIDRAKGNFVSLVGQQAPTESLQSSIPDNMYPMFLEQPYHTLCAVSEATEDNHGHLSPSQALNHDFYRLFNIVGIDEEQQSIYLSGKVKQQQACFWALRDNAIAEKEWNLSLRKLAQTIKQPAFAILCCSESRGPYFHGGDDDTDLALFKKYFPNTPLIGIYSSGEISAGAHYKSLLRRYSSSLTVYES